jgi:hypothetical protein
MLGHGTCGGMITVVKVIMVKRHNTVTMWNDKHGVNGNHSNYCVHCKMSEYDDRRMMINMVKW